MEEKDLVSLWKQSKLLLIYSSLLSMSAVPHTVSGPLEIIGPKVVTLQGGMAGVYLKTTGSAGEAQVKLSLEGAKSKLLRFTIEVCDTI